MKGRKIFLLACVLIVIVLLVIYFNKPSEDVVRLGVLQSWILEGPFYIAQEKGFFEEEGVNVEIVEIGNFGEFVPALISGEILLAENTADSFIIQSVTEPNLRQVLRKASIFGVDGIVATNDVQSLKDLKGKEIAVETISPSHFLLLNKLKEAGLSSSEVELLPTNAGDAGAAFLTGGVDVAVTWEPWLSRASEREDGHLLYSTKDEPDLIYDILMTRGDLNDKEKEDVGRILRAWFKALKFIEENPEESKDIFVRGLGLPDEEIEFFLTKVGFTDYEENIRFFRDDAVTYTDNAAQIWLDEGIITEKSDASIIIDPSYLNELYH
jgi:NitT/TauT family transport system substrate-binding protein